MISKPIEVKAFENFKLQIVFEYGIQGQIASNIALIQYSFNSA